MKRKIFYGLVAIVAAFGFTSCNLDINEDPYAVTKLDVEQLLTAAEYEVGINFAEGYYLNANFSAYTHHTSSREVDNYSLNASYSTLGNTWDQAYRYSIKNCDKLIEDGDANGNAIYAAIGRILRAHVYMNLVDLWGDVPYTEANNTEFTEPKPDKGAFIYNDLLKSINKAIADLKDTEAENKLKPGANDLFYKGDVTKWIHAANTLKLKLLVQSRLVKGEIEGWKSELDGVLAENAFLANGEDLQFPHSTATTPSDERNSGYVDEYQGGQKSVWISPWFYEILNGKSYNFKDNPFKGIVDPRVPYFYYNQATASKDALNPTDYRDGAFISIMLGSNSGYTSNTQESVMTCVGIYPVGGKYDDGKGGAISAKTGTGIAPDKMLQAYSVPFMKAELVLAGEAAGDAQALLAEGISASLTHVNTVSKAADASCPMISADAATEFINNVVSRFEAANAAKKMEILMTQKWIANFYNPVEAYNDIRRTGYPILFKGDDKNMAYTPYAQSVEAKPELTPYNLVTILAYPRVMWYPQGEVDVNPNISNEGRVVSSKVVFWDK
ncbi:MAG: SusD/RagB family nutrient-binding outer membrane lipoprotein [Bacteroidales bacterium]|nr:SusD/RagB family nutrient-binding outer membrane lipoprotein [Bacteroidales bacterium]